MQRGKVTVLVTSYLDTHRCRAAFPQTLPGGFRQLACGWAQKVSKRKKKRESLRGSVVGTTARASRTASGWSAATRSLDIHGGPTNKTCIYIFMSSRMAFDAEQFVWDPRRHQLYYHHLYKPRPARNATFPGASRANATGPRPLDMCLTGSFGCPCAWALDILYRPGYMCTT